jgi:hypothetical protein
MYQSNRATDLGSEHQSADRCIDLSDGAYIQVATDGELYVIEPGARLSLKVISARRVVPFIVLLLVSARAALCGPPAAASLAAQQPAADTSVAQTGLLEPTPTSLLAYLNSLRGSGKMLSGQWADHFSRTTSGAYGGYLDQFLPVGGATPANITVNSCQSGSAGRCAGEFTDAHLTPAILSVQLNSAGTCGSSQSVNQSLAVINGQLAAGGIVQVAFNLPSPTQKGCSFLGDASEFPAVITPGTKGYNRYMYGSVGNTSTSGNSGTPCTAARPCGGVWAAAQALLQITSGYKVLFRTLHEANLCQKDFIWWGTCGLGRGGAGTASNADYVALFRQTIGYLRRLGVNNIVAEYNFNGSDGAYSDNDPGSGYRDVISGDIYGPTTQTGSNSVESRLSDPSGGFTYAQRQGVPVLLAEAGVQTADNRLVTLYTYHNDIWNQAIQQGSGITNLVGDVIWNQHWCLECQLSALGYLQNTITRSQLPVIRN